MIHGNAQGLVCTFPWLACPHLHGKFSPAANDILFFLFMCMGGSRHALLRVHEFFAILRLIREIYENKPKARPITQAKVGDIPARVWRQNPMMGSKALGGRSNQRVNFATFHEDGSAACKFKSMARSFRYIFRFPVVIAISGPELLVGLRHGCSPGRGKKRVPFFAAQGNRKRLGASPQSIRPCSPGKWPKPKSPFRSIR